MDFVTFEFGNQKKPILINKRLVRAAFAIGTGKVQLDFDGVNSITVHGTIEEVAAKLA